jgi:hypothetical protein
MSVGLWSGFSMEPFNSSWILIEWLKGPQGGRKAEGGHWICFQFLVAKGLGSHMKGGFMDETLIKTLIRATGLPQEEAQKMLRKILMDSGKNPQEFSLEDLRLIMGQLLQDLFCEVQDNKNPYIKLLG